MPTHSYLLAFSLFDCNLNLQVGTLLLRESTDRDVGRPCWCGSLLKGVKCKVKGKEADTLLSLTQTDVFADQTWSHACVVLKQQGSLTKRLFEHWLDISQSYKKQRGIGLCWAREGGQIQHNPFFPPFCWISLPVPMQISCTGFGSKDICDPNAMLNFTRKKWTFRSSRTG